MFYEIDDSEHFSQISNFDHIKTSENSFNFNFAGLMIKVFVYKQKP